MTVSASRLDVGLGYGVVKVEFSAREKLRKSVHTATGRRRTTFVCSIYNI